MIQNDFTLSVLGKGFCTSTFGLKQKAEEIKGLKL